jgi:hypothetical protein
MDTSDKSSMNLNYKLDFNISGVVLIILGIYIILGIIHLILLQYISYNIISKYVILIFIIINIVISMLLDHYCSFDKECKDRINTRIASQLILFITLIVIVIYYIF